MSPQIEDRQHEEESATEPKFARLGVALILLSGVFWFSLFAVPFLPLTTGQKALTAGGLFAAVQVSWWIGAALAGPRVVKKFMGWLRRSDESAE